MSLTPWTNNDILTNFLKCFFHQTMRLNFEYFLNGPVHLGEKEVLYVTPAQYLRESSDDSFDFFQWFNASTFEGIIICKSQNFFIQISVLLFLCFYFLFSIRTISGRKPDHRVTNHDHKSTRLSGWYWELCLVVSSSHRCSQHFYSLSLLWSLGRSMSHTFLKRMKNSCLKKIW